MKDLADHALAVFIDYENLAMGTGERSRKGKQKPGPAPDMSAVLGRLVEKGRISVKRAYCDWQRFETAVTPLHELGVELIEIPGRAYTGKNSADIRLAVDAMEMSFAKTHIDTFVICSGDSDFSPLVAKLKELGKQVIGVGTKTSTSDLLANNCDEFIFYEDIMATHTNGLPLYKEVIKKDAWPVYELLFETIVALQRDSDDHIHASRLKDTMKRKRPGFTESAFGYRSFSHLLMEASSKGLITIHKDGRSGTFVVEGFAQ